MYRAPEMVDLFMRDELTEKTDIWVCVNVNYIYNYNFDYYFY